MSTTNNSDEELEEVNENKEKLFENDRGEENLIVIGDWNAIVGEEKVMNLYGLGKRNDIGERTLEFCAKYNLTATNTCFNHHQRRYTWKIPGDINRCQIGYITVKNRFRNQVKESKSYPGADINNNYNLVMKKCYLKFKRIVSKKKMVQLHIKNLRDGETRKQCVQMKAQMTRLSKKHLTPKISKKGGRT